MLGRRIAGHDAVEQSSLDFKPLLIEVLSDKPRYEGGLFVPALETIRSEARVLSVCQQDADFAHCHPRNHGSNRTAFGAGVHKSAQYCADDFLSFPGPEAQESA